MKKLLNLLLAGSMALSLMVNVTAEETVKQNVSDTSLLPVTGLELDSWETILANREKEPAIRTFTEYELPRSVDLASKFPAPHARGQQSQFSCAPWAVAYALKSGQENIARNWGIDTDNHLFSPSYLYNQLNGGNPNNGVSLGATLKLVVEQGVCTLESFPYENANWISQPTSVQRDEAAQFKAVGWNTIIGLDNLKKRLAGGDGIIIAFNVLPQFDKLNSMPLLEKPGSIQVYNDPTGSSRGVNAVCLIGYDDDLQAIKFINSWGNRYGYSGYGWIAYDMLSNPNVNHYGVEFGHVLNSRHNYTIDATVLTGTGVGTVPGGTITGGKVYNHGENVTLNATPKSNYEFIGWYEDGVKIKVKGTTLTFPAVANRSLEARFEMNSGTAGIVQASTGYTHTLALSGDGTVWASGLNTSGQLGDGTYSNKTSPVQVKNYNGIGVLTDIVSVSNGELHSLALKNDGTVWAWGKGVSGRLGNNSTDSTNIPVQVKGADGAGVLTNVIAISAGYNHNLALKADGTVWAWGYGEYGALGNGATTNSNAPIQVKDPSGNGFLSDIISVVASRYYSYALKPDGTVYAWGRNDSGRLGDGMTANRHLPFQIPGLVNVASISSFSYHTLALKSDGTVWAWGKNASGRTGTGGRDGYILAPRQVKGVNDNGFLNGISAISAGEDHSLAIKEDGTVLSWGDNSNGQLGYTGVTESVYPTVVNGINSIASVTAGGDYSTALSSDGMLYAWGYNQYGKFGVGSSNDISATPVQAFTSGIEYGDVSDVSLTPTNGVILDSWETILAHQEELPAAELFSKLPSSVDLTSKFPKPHATGQGSQNNCVAFAVAYNLKSGQENIARNWGTDTNEHLFSPSFIYNQVNGGSKDEGISIGVAMGLVVDQGVCTLNSFSYESLDWKKQPDEVHKAEAAQYKAESWNSIIGLEAIKRRLATGDGVIVGVNALQQFYDVYGRPQSGSIKVYNDPTGIKKGTHALCLIGYDDELQAFKFINSWNANYGYSGYGWIAYDMLSDDRVNEHGKEYGYVLNTLRHTIATSEVTVETEPGGTVKGGGIYCHDAVVTLIAEPYSNYDFIGWYEGGIKISDDKSLTFRAKEDRTLEARFKMKEDGAAAPVYIMAAVGLGGIVTGDGVYECGDIVTLTASPDTGYSFDGWYENGVKIAGAGATYSFVAEDFRMLEARFK